jgi:tRNA threonylcarbamoyl adenosine modification protein (Sua5/YciO/YrdC/YwlC family)
MLLRIRSDNPEIRHIRKTAECLRNSGVIIYPTDTLYGLGCDIYQYKAIERIARIKKINPHKANFSMICYDLSHLSDFCKQIPTPVFRLLKEYLPGPYTFILPASKLTPKILQSRKDTIGLRIPDNNIARAIVKELGHPILSSSLPGEMVEDYTVPEIMHENFRNEVDIVIDGGIGGTEPSTVIDCTGEEPVLVRQGLGDWESP